MLRAAPTNEGPQTGAGGEGDARNEEVTHLSRQSTGVSLACNTFLKDDAITVESSAAAPAPEPPWNCRAGEDPARGFR